MPKLRTGQSNGNFKHGLRKTAEYRSWAHIVQRCTNPNVKSWPDYGGRGILICPEWRIDPAAFIHHIGPKPGPEFSVERIDNNKGYEPGNVKWGTRSEQSFNRRPYKTGVRKLVCPSGHPYDEKNTRIMQNGARRCRTCINLYARLKRKEKNV